MGQQLASDPIDVVYTWVDGFDSAWRERKQARLASLGAVAQQLDPTATSRVRYLSRDELRYSLRSLERFAPFVRNVYLVTDRQVPPWLDVDHPGLVIVPHEDLFPDPSHLPSFSSQAIESHLHRIPGLAEHFVYFNDDVLLYRPCTAADFFDQQGRSVVYLDRRPVVWDEAEPGYSVGVNAAARNSSKLLEATLGYRIERRIDHTPHALRRSVLEEIWKRFPDELEALSAQPFRHPGTVALTSCLAPHYGLCTGTAVSVSDARLVYLKVKKKRRSSLKLARKLLRELSQPSPEARFFSLNDSGELDDSRLTAALIALFFRLTYPRRSRFERAR